MSFPTAAESGFRSTDSVLIAGLGNVFHGDDGFGVEVARQLDSVVMPRATRVVDFGIRGFDLALALGGGYQLVIIVDAVSQGRQPGKLVVWELPSAGEAAAEQDAAGGDGALPDLSHDVTPHAAINLARRLHPQVVLPRMLLVGCEVATLEDEDGAMGLSEPVAAAVTEAVGLIVGLLSGSLNVEPA